MDPPSISLLPDKPNREKAILTYHFHSSTLRIVSTPDIFIVECSLYFMTFPQFKYSWPLLLLRYFLRSMFLLLLCPQICVRVGLVGIDGLTTLPYFSRHAVKLLRPVAMGGQSD